MKNTQNAINMTILPSTFDKNFQICFEISSSKLQDAHQIVSCSGSDMVINESDKIKSILTQSTTEPVESDSKSSSSQLKLKLSPIKRKESLVNIQETTTMTPDISFHSNTTIQHEEHSLVSINTYATNPKTLNGQPNDTFITGLKQLQDSDYTETLVTTMSRDIATIKKLLRSLRLPKSWYPASHDKRRLESLEALLKIRLDDLIVARAWSKITNLLLSDTLPIKQ